MSISRRTSGCVLLDVNKFNKITSLICCRLIRITSSVFSIYFIEIFLSVFIFVKPFSNLLNKCARKNDSSPFKC